MRVGSPDVQGDGHPVGHRHEPLDGKCIALRGFVGICTRIVGSLPDLHLADEIWFLHAILLIFHTSDVKRDQGRGWHEAGTVLLCHGLCLPAPVTIAHRNAD